MSLGLILDIAPLQPCEMLHDFNSVKAGYCHTETLYNISSPAQGEFLSFVFSFSSFKIHTGLHRLARSSAPHSYSGNKKHSIVNMWLNLKVSWHHLSAEEKWEREVMPTCTHTLLLPLWWQKLGICRTWILRARKWFSCVPKEERKWIWLTSVSFCTLSLHLANGGNKTFQYFSSHWIVWGCS